MNRLILLALVLCTFGSCRVSIRLKVRELPPVYLHDDVKALGVVNRSFGDKNDTGSKLLDIMDKGLTLEGKNLDSTGSEVAVDAVIDRLERFGRFEKVARLPQMETKKPIPDQMYEPIPWDEVEKICVKNDVQVLFVLESFDTDSDINYDMRKTTIKGPLGTEIPAIEHIATLKLLIKQGWRIYDPASKTILDGTYRSNSKTNTSRGINPVKAAEGLMTRRSVVKDLSWDIAHGYPDRIQWVSFWVSREYYGKGNQRMKIARRSGAVRDWDRAAEIWREEIANNPKRKIVGRCCFNMALYEEIYGNLDEAKEWAQRSYSEYGTRGAADYYEVLRRRKIREDEKLRIINGN